MKRIQYLTGLFLTAVLLFSSSCKKYLDVNSDPNNPTSVPVDSRLVGAITTTNGAAMWRGARELVGAIQYASTKNTTGTNKDAETWRFTASYFLWQNAYTWAIPNCVDMALLGEKDGSPHFVGAAKTLLAVNFGLLTDQYGPIVLKDAYDGVSQVKLTPTFDPQELVYPEIDSILNDAITAFNSTANKTALNNTSGDILYQGNVDKWRRFAWSLKARYLNHLSKKGPLYNAAKIIEACKNGFNGDNMDAEFAYISGAQQTDENPWYSWGGFTSATDPRYFTWTQFFVDILTRFPVTENAYTDPRIAKIMSPAPSDGKYRGLKPGVGLGGGQGGTGFFKNEADYGKFSNSGFYTKATSPFPFITYSEVKLIEAEAKVRSGDMTGALTAYEEGVKANMRKLGVTTADINSYWAAQVADNIAAHFLNQTNALSHIMRQKYISLCLNPETWVDMRRMDYSQQIYGPSLQRPSNLNTVVFSATDNTDWIRAMVYETNEQNRNPAAVGDNSETTRLRKRLWWDMP